MKHTVHDRTAQERSAEGEPTLMDVTRFYERAIGEDDGCRTKSGASPLSTSPK